MIMAGQDPYFSSYFNEIDSGLPVAQGRVKRSILYHSAQESNQISAEKFCFL